MTFFFLLTGETPYGEGTVSQKLRWHRTRTPKSVRELRPEVSRDIDAIIMKMLAKEPVRRYQVPGEVAAALAPWVSEEPDFGDVSTILFDYKAATLHGKDKKAGASEDTAHDASRTIIQPTLES